MAQSNTENHLLDQSNTTPSLAPSSSSDDNSALKEECLEILKELSEKPKYQPLLKRIFYDANGIKRDVPNLNAYDDRGQTPLYQVVSDGEERFLLSEAKKVIALLLDAGANIELGDRHENETPLIAAIRHLSGVRGRSLVKLLLDGGADINRFNTKHRWTALGYAILAFPPSKQKLGIIKFLLDHHADREKCYYERSFFSSTNRRQYLCARTLALRQADYALVNFLAPSDANVDTSGTVPLETAEPHAPAMPRLSAFGLFMALMSFRQATLFDSSSHSSRDDDVSSSDSSSYSGSDDERFEPSAKRLRR